MDGWLPLDVLAFRQGRNRGLGSRVWENGGMVGCLSISLLFVRGETKVKGLG
jgi:hypothetical protein